MVGEIRDAPPKRFCAWFSSQPCKTAEGLQPARGARSGSCTPSSLCRRLKSSSPKLRSSLIPSISSSFRRRIQGHWGCWPVAVSSRFSKELSVNLQTFASLVFGCRQGAVCRSVLSPSIPAFDLSRLSNTQCSSRPRSTVAGVDPIAVPRRWASRSGAAEHGAAGVKALRRPLGGATGRHNPCQSITCAPARASVIRPLPVRPELHPGCLPMRPAAYHGVSPGPGTWRIPASCSQMLSSPLNLVDSNTCNRPSHRSSEAPITRVHPAAIANIYNLTHLICPCVILES